MRPIIISYNESPSAYYDKTFHIWLHPWGKHGVFNLYKSVVMSIGQTRDFNRPTSSCYYRYYYFYFPGLTHWSDLSVDFLHTMAQNMRMWPHCNSILSGGRHLGFLKKRSIIASWVDAFCRNLLSNKMIQLHTKGSVLACVAKIAISLKTKMAVVPAWISDKAKFHYGWQIWLKPQIWRAAENYLGPDFRKILWRIYDHKFVITNVSYDELTTKLWRFYDHKYANFRKILWRFYNLKLWQSSDHK